MAKRFGADALLNASELDERTLIDAVIDSTCGLGADLVIEVAGTAAVIESGIRMLRDRRTLSVARSDIPR